VVEEVSEDDVAYDEDLEFCCRAEGLGYPVHLHTGAKLGHAKRLFIGESTWSALGD
jgi:GT2 family glycosyltransferase